MESTAWSRLPPEGPCPSRGYRRGSLNLTISRIENCRRTAGDAASLPDPGDDDDALFRQESAEFLADRGALPGRALFIRTDQPGHQADIEFGKLAACVGNRIEAEVEHAFAERGELGHRLHHRRVWIDLAAKFVTV